MTEQEEEENTSIHRKPLGATNTETVKDVMSEVNNIRSGGGSPLDPSTREFMEFHFGYNFSKVRIHADERAARSARSLSALAYTIGDDIMFADEQYQPNTLNGRRLLAHELTHVVQQDSQVPLLDEPEQNHTISNSLDGHSIAVASEVRDEHDADAVANRSIWWNDPASRGTIGEKLLITKGAHLVLQRYVTCESQENCPPRVSGEAGRARRDLMLVGGVSGPVSGLLVGNFAIGSSSIKPDLASNPIWNYFLGQLTANTDRRWEILGFTDCHGGEALNQSLREERASSLYSIMPEMPRAQVDSASAAPLTNCMSENTDEAGRAHNRSAFIRLKSTEITFDPEEVSASFCGPEVKDWLINQMNTNQNHSVIRTGRENRWPRWVPVFNIGWTAAAFSDFAGLVGPGGPWDFKRTATWWRAGSGRSCPTPNCDKTVSLCGHCVNHDVIGNIHFGWVGRRMEIAPWALHTGAGLVQEGGAAGDDPPDTVAIDIGIAMADEGKFLCDEVNAKVDRLNRDRTKGCSQCM